MFTWEGYGVTIELGRDDSPIPYLTGWWCNNHLEKYEFVNGVGIIPYMKWKIIQMFETTNQLTPQN